MMIKLFPYWFDSPEWWRLIVLALSDLNLSLLQAFIFSIRFSGFFLGLFLKNLGFIFSSILECSRGRINALLSSWGMPDCLKVAVLGGFLASFFVSHSLRIPINGDYTITIRIKKYFLFFEKQEIEGKKMRWWTNCFPIGLIHQNDGVFSHCIRTVWSFSYSCNLFFLGFLENFTKILHG